MQPPGFTADGRDGGGMEKKRVEISFNMKKNRTILKENHKNLIFCEQTLLFL